MLSTGHKLLPASCSLHRFPFSLSVSISRSHFSVCLPLLWKDSRQVWQENRQMARMTGETFGVGNEIQKMWRKGWIQHKHTHTQAGTHILLFCCFIWWLVSLPHKLQLWWCTHSHTHTVHMPSIISLFDALALRLIHMLESVTAYNITMMEMSLSSSVLWLTCVLVAKIEFQVLISYIWQCLYTVISVYIYIYSTHIQYTEPRCIRTDLYM